MGRCPGLQDDYAGGAVVVPNQFAREFGRCPGLQNEQAGGAGLLAWWSACLVVGSPVGLLAWWWAPPPVRLSGGPLYCSQARSLPARGLCGRLDLFLCEAQLHQRLPDRVDLIVRDLDRIAAAEQRP